MVTHQEIFERVRMLPFVPLSPPQKRPVVKHILRCGIKGPVVSLSRIPRLSGNFDKAVIKGKVMPNRILPHRILFSIIGKLASYKVTNSRESKFLLWRLEDGHGDKSNVGIGGFDVVRLLRRG
jgi:hypothetical protein